MLPETFILEVVTPERQLVEAHVQAAQLPGTRGYLGILPGHAPLLTELGIGEMTYRSGQSTHHLAIVGGYAEVLPERVIVLAKTGERAEEIDLERAKTARERAEKRLARPGDPDVDWDRATLALKRAMIRVQVATKGGAEAAAEKHHAAP